MLPILLQKKMKIKPTMVWPHPNNSKQWMTKTNVKMTPTQKRIKEKD